MGSFSKFLSAFWAIFCLAGCLLAVASDSQTGEFLQTSMRWATQPQIKQAIEQIRTNPNQKIALYSEIGWFLFILLVRAWQSSKVSKNNWFRSMIFRLCSLVLGMVGSSLIIPLIFFGDPYLKLITETYKLWRR